jgi:broad specificity phosphatase PhoE
VIAARAALASIPFDRVVTSGLPRTVEAARIVAPGRDSEEWTELQEIRGGRLGDIPPDRLEETFTHAFRGVIPEQATFLAGETIGSLFDRSSWPSRGSQRRRTGTLRSPSSTAASTARSCRRR